MILLKEEKRPFFCVSIDLNYRTTCESLRELAACSSRSHSFSSLPNFYSRFLLLTATKIIKLTIASHLENQVNPMNEWFANGQQKNTKNVILQKRLTAGISTEYLLMLFKEFTYICASHISKITQSRRFKRIGN